MPPLGDLGVTYTVHLWLVGKRVVDFLLVLINCFRQLLRLRRYEWIFVEIVVFKNGVGHFERKFNGEGGIRPPTTLGVRKLGVLGLSRGVVCVILRLTVVIQYRGVTDRQTDTRRRLIPAHR